EAKREDARRGVAHVGLVLVDELDAGGRIRRAGLERRLEVAEIAEFLADPVGIVVEHLDGAAWRYPADLLGGEGAVDAAQAADRGDRDPGGGETEETATADLHLVLHVSSP